MDKFFESYKWLKLTQEEIESLNSFISSKEIKFAILHLTKKIPSPRDFTRDLENI